MLIFFVIVTAISSIWLVCDILSNRHPLTDDEVEKLLQRRQWRKGLQQYKFSDRPIPANPKEKKRMRSKGEWVQFREDFRFVPARMAGFLKYKKHEWVVIVIVRSQRSEYLWWNKGDDNSSVSPLLSLESMISEARTLNADIIAVLHNHPNPNPSLYSCIHPSDQDLVSAKWYCKSLSQSGIGLLEFVCERGIPYLYFAHFTNKVVPPEPILSRIQDTNGSGTLNNYSLRCELRKMPRKFRGIYTWTDLEGL